MLRAALVGIGIFAAYGFLRDSMPTVGCRLGIDLACANAGLAYEQHTPPNFLIAREYYERGCNRGQPMSCNNLAVVYEQGKGVPKDEKRAAGLYAQACDSGEMLACRNLGNAYVQGYGVSVDLRRATALFARACTGGVAKACNDQALLVAKNDRKLAVTLFQRACDGGNDEGCANFAINLITGSGIVADPERGIALLNKGCTLNDHARSCLLLGAAHVSGKGLPLDPKRAVDRFRAACRLGEPMGCKLVKAYDSKSRDAAISTDAMFLGIGPADAGMLD
jgi:TPR repeat protein